MIQGNSPLIQVLHSVPFHLHLVVALRHPPLMDLAGTQLTDEDMDQNQKDESLVKYLIGGH